MPYFNTICEKRIRGGNSTASGNDAFQDGEWAKAGAGIKMERWHHFYSSVMEA
jgi:hypothetical protein